MSFFSAVPCDFTCSRVWLQLLMSFLIGTPGRAAISLRTPAFVLSFILCIFTQDVTLPTLVHASKDVMNSQLSIVICFYTYFRYV